MSGATRDLWRQRHRFCTDEAPPIESLEQARAILDDHGRHDEKCLQLRAALHHVTAFAR